MSTVILCGQLKCRQKGRARVKLPGIPAAPERVGSRTVHRSLTACRTTRPATQPPKTVRRVIPEPNALPIPRLPVVAPSSCYHPAMSAFCLFAFGFRTVARFARNAFHVVNRFVESVGFKAPFPLGSTRTNGGVGLGVRGTSRIRYGRRRRSCLHFLCGRLELAGPLLR